jgi:mRNA interferase MazF
MISGNNPLVIDPKRGEIWNVRLDPTEGSEISKERPCVVVVGDFLTRNVQVRIVVPITGWKDQFRRAPYFIRIEPDSQNGLDKTSAANSLQVRALSTKRFVNKRGLLDTTTLGTIVKAVCICIGHTC